LSGTSCIDSRRDSPQKDKSNPESRSPTPLIPVISHCLSGHDFHVSQSQKINANSSIPGYTSCGVIIDLDRNGRGTSKCLQGNIPTLSLFKPFTIDNTTHVQKKIMSQTITPLVAQLIKVHTSLPFEHVVSRLDKETNKEGSADIVPRIKASKDQAELVALIHNSLGESGFLYVSPPFSSWPEIGLLTPLHSYFSETSYNHLEKAEKQPKLLVYVIGNPLIAKSILRDNPFAALHVPLRLTIAELPERKGTIVAYYHPSSVMIRPDEKHDTSLIKLLDDKLEKLVSRITQTGGKARL